MKAVLCFILVLFVIGLNATTMKAFDEWSRKFGKVYADPNEEDHRFAVWRGNLDRIEELNRKSKESGTPDAATFAINKFGDLTTEEFEARYNSAIIEDIGHFDDNTPLINHPTDNIAPLSAAVFDWREKGVVTDVKDQGHCGSCWAFAATEGVESVCMIKNGINASDFAPLAPQQLVDCDTYSYGCDGGYTVQAYDYVKKAGGLVTEKDYPYTAKDGVCDFDKSKVKCAIQGGVQLRETDEKKIASVLASTSPFGLTVNAAPWQFYKTGVLTKSDCRVASGHAVQLVGYNLTAETPYWIVRNSWGEDWGMDGFILLEFGENTCGMNQRMSYPIA